MLELARETSGVQAERGLELLVLKIKLARDQERAAQLLDGLVRRQMRPLVEPFRHEKLGGGADRPALAFDLDLNQHEGLRRRMDDDIAEAERPGKRHRSFKKRDIAYGEARCHRRALVQRTLGEEVLADAL